MKVEIARVLKDEGFIADYKVTEPAGPGQLLTIDLKPRTNRGRALSGLRRISRPGLRVYARKTEIPRVIGGLGIAIISTSQGLMTGHAAQRAGLGGEVVAYVW
jgi:small subunit ribosomal protein S8